jgi:urea transport system substrate-binding protein
MQRRTFVTTAAAAWAGSLLATPSAWAEDTVKVAVILPLSGPASLFGPPAKNCATMVAEQINARGGLLGRKIEILFGDGGLPPAESAQTALKLWKGQGAQILVGMHDSAVRVALVGMFKGQIPYFFTPNYEGGECGAGMFMSGETPQQSFKLVMPWLMAERDAKKWYLVGNDYVWGRVTNQTVRGYITDAGGTVLGDEYLPFTVDNFDSTLARIRETGAEGVVVSLVGGSAVSFNRAFAGFGLQDKVVRIGSVLEENTLAGIGNQNAKNLYSVAAFFGNLDTPPARAFKEAYFKRFGEQAPALNALAESVVEGFLLLEAVAKKANSLKLADMERAAEGATYNGPRGTVTLKNRHVDQDMYVADVGPQGFKIVKTFPNVPSGQVCKA